MLFPQVPTAVQQEIAAELKFDVKLLSGKISTKRESLDTDVAKLKVVERHIMRGGNVGTPEAPNGSWIRGILPTRAFRIRYFKEPFGIVFVGKKDIPSEDRELSISPDWGLQRTNIFGLAGSAQNIVGTVSADLPKWSFSFLPDILHGLIMADEELYVETRTDEEIRAFMEGGVAGSRLPWIESLLRLWANDDVALQNVEFLARRLATYKFANGKSYCALHCMLLSRMSRRLLGYLNRAVSLENDAW
jgi:hypothetical protein